MKYKKWNKALLNDQLKQAYKAYYEEPSLELLETIKSIQDLIDNTPGIFIPMHSFDEQLSYDKYLLNQYKPFIPYIKEFAKYDESLNKKCLPELTSYSIPTRCLLSFVHDFYNSLDREIAKYFNKIYKERHNNFRITTKSKKGFSRNYMTYLDYFNYAYININRTNTIDDYTSIVHEYAHAIADQMKYRPKYGSYPFIELLPLLMEEIAYDELLRCYDKLENEVLTSNANETKTVLKYAKEIALQEKYLSEEIKQSDRKQFISSMAQYTNNTKTKIERILNITLQEKMSYVVPYLVMIELYDMYYKDQDKCMYTIKKIITMDECDDYIEYLKSLGINLNGNSEEYIENQKKEIRLTKIM